MYIFKNIVNIIKFILGIRDWVQSLNPQFNQFLLNKKIK